MKVVKRSLVVMKGVRDRMGYTIWFWNTLVWTAETISWINVEKGVWGHLRHSHVREHWLEKLKCYVVGKKTWDESCFVCREKERTWSCSSIWSFVVGMWPGSWSCAKFLLASLGEMRSHETTSIEEEMREKRWHYSLGEIVNGLWSLINVGLRIRIFNLSGSIDL